MMANKHHSGSRFLLLLASSFLLLITGCSFTPATPNVTPTTQGIPPTGQDFLGAISVDEGSVSIFNSGSLVQTLSKGQVANLQLNDLVSQDNSGRSIIRFLDDLEVELLRGTELVLAEAREETGGSLFIRLRQNFGHLHLTLNPQAIVQAVVETGDVTIKTLERGTEFFVCYAPGALTCHPVITGQIEIVGQGVQEIVDGGSASYTFSGAPPQPAICADMAEISDWYVRFRSLEPDVVDLGSVVQSWPQEPCDGIQPTLPAANAPPQDVASPTVELVPTATQPPLNLSARINHITLNEHQQYVVDYETYGYTEQLPGQHVHFFFNTVPPEQAGHPGSGPWYVYGGPRPFMGYSLGDRLHDATQMCILVANPDHSVLLNTGNCVDLPPPP
jgi:hypothetical protein